MMTRALFLCLVAALAGCAAIVPPVEEAPVVVAAPPDQPRPQARPEGLRTAPRPPATARTVEQFDTTTRAERAAAVAAAAEAPAGGPLGSTVASLGDPAKPGFWIETPLADKAGTGRVTYNGKSVQVDLIPIAGPKTAGSRMSLAAMRLIDAPLAGLPQVQVFSDG